MSTYANVGNQLVETTTLPNRVLTLSRSDITKDRGNAIAAIALKNDQIAEIQVAVDRFDALLAQCDSLGVS